MKKFVMKIIKMKFLLSIIFFKILFLNSKYLYISIILSKFILYKKFSEIKTLTNPHIKLFHINIPQSSHNHLFISLYFSNLDRVS